MTPPPDLSRLRETEKDALILQQWQWGLWCTNKGCSSGIDALYREKNEQV